MKKDYLKNYNKLFGITIKEIVKSDVACVSGGCSCVCNNGQGIGTSSSFADCDRTCAGLGKGGARSCNGF